MTATHPHPTPEQVGAFYDEMNQLVARFQGGSIHYGWWNGPEDDSSFEQAAERFTDILTGKLGAGPGDHVLDVGCGTGKPGVQLARATGARVTGVSISRGDVDAANALAAAEGLTDRVRFEMGNALDLPYPDASFDQVLAFESIIHLPDRVAAMREMARVVKPGGRVAITDFVHEGPEITDDRIREALADALAAFAAAPLAQKEDYPGLVRDAGLVLDEFADVTAHTQYTYPKMLEAMIEYARETGDESPGFTRMMSALNPPDAADLELPEGEGERVIVVVAHRPAR